MISVFLFFNLIFVSFLCANNAHFTVGFGKGGSNDRMVRTMEPYISKILGKEIHIQNIHGKGSQLAIDHFLSSPNDDYNVFVSSFVPYISNAILHDHKDYKVSDFEIINIQWLDFDLIAVHKDSAIDSLKQLFEGIKRSPKKLKVGVIYRSSGHLMLNLILDTLGIEKSKIEYVYYEGGQKTRLAIRDQEVDFVIVSAKGSETVRDHIRPLSLIKDRRSTHWDAPTLNEALISYDVRLPVIPGSMRGYAVKADFKKKYPEKYKKLVNTFIEVLSLKQMQKTLKQKNIGYLWLGPEQSNRIFQETHQLIQTFNYVFDDEKQ